MKIITANVYAHNRKLEQAKQTLEDTDAVVIGAQEAWRFGVIHGYSRHDGDGLGGRPCREVPIFLRREGTEYLGEGAFCVKPDLGASFTPERWITWLRFAHEGHRFALINTHLDAVLQDPDDGELRRAARVGWAERHMRRLVAEVRRHRRDGFRPIVTGDFNYFPRKGQTDVWRWSPHVALTRVKLDYDWHRLDGIAVPSTLDASSARDFELPGSDHRAVARHLTLPRRGA